MLADYIVWEEHDIASDTVTRTVKSFTTLDGARAFVQSQAEIVPVWRETPSESVIVWNDPLTTAPWKIKCNYSTDTTVVSHGEYTRLQSLNAPPTQAALEGAALLRSLTSLQRIMVNLRPDWTALSK